MTHGSLFSGIGGFDLAAEWMGWENVFHCEWNEFGQKILKYYWPNATSYGDITKTDFTIWRGRVDVLSGGFPCQPYSTAGKRLGKEDDRHLWPEMLRAIREIQPRWVVGENVLGLVNWSGGLVFHEVQTDLETEGYEVFPYVLPACGVGAIHRRERVWFVARNSKLHGCSASEVGESNKESQVTTRADEIRQSPGTDSVQSIHEFNPNNDSFRFNICERKYEINTSEGRKYALNDIEQTTTTNSERIGQQGQRWTERQVCSTEDRNWEAGWFNSISGWPTEPPVYTSNDGFSTGLDIETISEKDWLEESLKGCGNAIVPQVAFQLFKTIEQFENIK